MDCFFWGASNQPEMIQNGYPSIHPSIHPSQKIPLKVSCVLCVFLLFGLLEINRAYEPKDHLLGKPGGAPRTSLLASFKIAPQDASTMGPNAQFLGLNQKN